MQHTGLARKNSSARGTSIRKRKGARGQRFACACRIEVSLERNKIYVVLTDESAEKDGDLRIVDESGEDYLFSAERFVAIDVPAAVRASLLTAS